jgi:hypothetical protein
MTGQPPSARDTQDAIEVVAKLVTLWIAKVPPELAVQGPNILRCLRDYQRRREATP